MDAVDLASAQIAKKNGGAWAEFGVGYEDRVVESLGRGRVETPAPGRQGLSQAQTIAFLRGLGRTEYAAQMNLRPQSRPKMLKALPDIKIRSTYPDLIHRDVSGPIPIFTVIDIKATRRATMFHKTQVAFYVRLLETVLADIGAPGVVNSDTGYIWRFPDNGQAGGSDYFPDPFKLEPYLRMVDDFFHATLPGISAKTVSPQKDDTFFHVYFKCEQCDYLEHCSKEVGPERSADKRDISAIFGMTHEAKRSLRAFGLTSVKQLADANVGIGKADGVGWSLSRRADVLINRAKALSSGKVMPGVDPHTFLMPPVNEVALYLVADIDPIDDGLVTIGYLYVGRDTVREMIEVVATSDRGAEADALVKVFAQIIADLEEVDRRNALLPENQGERAHIYFYEVAEANALQDAVKRHIDDPRVRGGLLHMVRLFPPDDVVPEPEFRGVQHMPATPLRSVVEHLLAVPTTVSYDLGQVSQALAREGSIAKAYEPKDGFARPFSSMLSIDIARGLRDSRRGGPNVEAVREDVSNRLEATRAIAEWLQDEHRRLVDAGQHKLLRLNKKPFALQATFNPLEAADLDVLRAFELLESRAGLLESLVRLAQPNDVRSGKGQAVGPMHLLKIEKGARDMFMLFKASPTARQTDISPGSFGLILTDGEPDYLLEPSLWPDLTCRLKPPAGDSGHDVLAVTVPKRAFDGKNFQEMKLRAGESGWWLDQAFVDINSSKSDAFLTFLAADKKP